MKEPTLPTAEETLQIAFGTIKANQSSEHKDVDPVLLHAIESHTAAHTAGLRDQIADLERENNNYRLVYDSVVKNRDELSGQLQSETESRKHWQRQAQRYQKYHKELNSALERVKELEEENEILRNGLHDIAANNEDFTKRIAYKTLNWKKWK